MTEAEDAKGFLGRWSERKRRSRRPAIPEAAPAAPAGEQDAPPLPPLDSLGADSDYTAFLRDGVAHALRASALRRAWATDPEIASFRGMAEYDWDFNVPGYGWLRPTDDVAALARRVFGEAPPTAPAAEEPATPPALADAREPVVPADLFPPENDAGTGVAAMEPEPAQAVPAVASAIRRHGGALPG